MATNMTPARIPPVKTPVTMVARRLSSGSGWKAPRDEDKSEPNHAMLIYWVMVGDAANAIPAREPKYNNRALVVDLRRFQSKAVARIAWAILQSSNKIAIFAGTDPFAVTANTLFNHSIRFPARRHAV